ncbi:coadhesin-like [Ptychodera flava]|uniref:coadhesin-like n=1 Tax=Ptychodera flava TaxID=63121 RepID=UPI00396A2770
MAKKLTVVTFLAVIGVAFCEVTRTGSSRYAFIELPRFEDCGMDVTYSPFKTTGTGSHAACAMRCLSDTLCKSTEYDVWNKTCNLYSVSILDKLEEKFGFTYADLTDSNPNVGIIHPCQTDPCNVGQICSEKCGPYGYLCECPEGMTGDNCNDVAPVNGKYTEWYDFSECSATCVITAYRNCTNPAPLAGGKECSGVNTKYEECGAEDCSVYPYLGCFTPASFGADTGPITDSSNDLDACASYCAANGYRIFATKKKGCFCKRNWEPTNGHDATKCTAKCPGDNSQTCGGSTYASIYSTGGPYRGCFDGSMDANAVEVGASMDWSPTTLAQTTTALPTTADSTTLVTTAAPTDDSFAANGTVKTTLGQTTASHTTIITTVDPTTINPTASPPSMTVDECRYACGYRGFIYASLSQGSTCTCHNLLTGLTLDKSESSCNIDCTGGDSGGAICGGAAAYSVFETEIYDMTEWTPWFDTDDPDDDGWDTELVSDHQSDFPWICASPLTSNAKHSLECPTMKPTKP